MVMLTLSFRFGVHCPVSNNGFLPVRFGSVWSGMVTVLSTVWPRGLLLCPFHKKLII